MDVRTLATFTLASIVSIALPACGDSPVPAQKTLTSDQFIDGLSDVACRRVTACAPAQAPLFCPLFRSGLDCTRRAVASGVIAYHGDSAQKCLDELAALTCAQLLSEDGGGFHTASCDATLSERFDMGQLVCDQDGGVHVEPVEPTPTTDGGTPHPDMQALPEGPPCIQDDQQSIEACPDFNNKDCRACLSIHGETAGVCVETCTVARQDCGGGRTCRPLSFGYDRSGNGLGCGGFDTGDGYCD